MKVNSLARDRLAGHLAGLEVNSWCWHRFRSCRGSKSGRSAGAAWGERKRDLRGRPGGLTSALGVVNLGADAGERVRCVRPEVMRSAGRCTPGQDEFSLPSKFREFVQCVGRSRAGE